jgi:hypothetical protein
VFKILWIKINALSNTVSLFIVSVSHVVLVIDNFINKYNLTILYYFYLTIMKYMISSFLNGAYKAESFKEILEREQLKQMLKSWKLWNIFVFIISACGEPPLCMSCSVLFALKHAVEAARQEVGQETYFPLGKYSVQDY